VWRLGFVLGKLGVRVKKFSNEIFIGKFGQGCSLLLKPDFSLITDSFHFGVFESGWCKVTIYDVTGVDSDSFYIFLDWWVDP